MTDKMKDTGYTHMEYRKAKVVHLINEKKETIFIYKGKEITKKKADEIVNQYKIDIQQRKNLSHKD